MAHPLFTFSTDQLVLSGLHALSDVHYQLSPEALIKDALRTGEGTVNGSGALVQPFDNSSRADTFIVKDHFTESAIKWNDANIPIEQKYFGIIYQKVTAYLRALPEFWVRDCDVPAAGHQPIGLRIVNENASGNLFACTAFPPPAAEAPRMVKPGWHLIAVPGLLLDAGECGTRRQHAVVTSFTHTTILIAGTGNNDAIKHAVATVVDYLPLHESL